MVFATKTAFLTVLAVVRIVVPFRTFVAYDGRFFILFYLVESRGPVVWVIRYFFWDGSSEPSDDITGSLPKFHVSDGPENIVIFKKYSRISVEREVFNYYLYGGLGWLHKFNSFKPFIHKKVQ